MSVPVKAEKQGRRLQVVITGHVVHGKSTVAGRWLVDTKGKLEQVRSMCGRAGRFLDIAERVGRGRDHDETLPRDGCI